MPRGIPGSGKTKKRRKFYRRGTELDPQTVVLGGAGSPAHPMDDSTLVATLTTQICDSLRNIGGMTGIIVAGRIGKD